MTAQKKKKHHYIPVSYLKNFADNSGYLTAHLKDKPIRTIRARPQEIGFEKYYYSQYIDKDTVDHNTLEDFFGSIETNWTPLYESISNMRDINNMLPEFFAFLGLMRMRVPAARDAFESLSAAHVMTHLKMMEHAGMLPDPPEGLENPLEWIQVAIDPQQSLAAMRDMASGFGEICGPLGFQIVHVPQDFSLVTSDNPVVYYDASLPEDKIRPYVAIPGIDEIELIFPVSPSIFVRGHTKLKFEFDRYGMRRIQLSSREELKRINRMIVRFSYRMVFDTTGQHLPLVRKHSIYSPVLRTIATPTQEGIKLFQSWWFGERQKKPKWDRNDND